MKPSGFRSEKSTFRIQKDSDILPMFFYRQYFIIQWMIWSNPWRYNIRIMSMRVKMKVQSENFFFKDRIHYYQVLKSAICHIIANKNPNNTMEGLRSTLKFKYHDIQNLEKQDWRFEFSFDIIYHPVEKNNF